MLDIILSLVRNALLAVGAGLVTNGYTSSTELETLVGAVVILVSLAWKLILKWKASKTTSA